MKQEDINDCHRNRDTSFLKDCEKHVSAEIEYTNRMFKTFTRIMYKLYSQFEYLKWHFTVNFFA